MRQRCGNHRRKTPTQSSPIDRIPGDFSDPRWTSSLLNLTITDCEWNATGLIVIDRLSMWASFVVASGLAPINGGSRATGTNPLP
jgi:hypothetical protein